MSETGLYAYAITRDLAPDDLAGRRGIGDAPIRLVEHGLLGAVVSEVDLDEFGEDGLRRNLEDLTWLEMVATAHDNVARDVAGRVPTVPLRLATVFLGEDSLRDRLAELADTASAALDRVTGRGEWSVKVYGDQQAEPAPADDPAPSGAGAGRAYLLQRRAATQRREEATRSDAELGATMHDRLREAAVASRRLAPQDRRLSRHRGEMVLNGAYLVDNDRVDSFTALVDELGGLHEHVRVELGGPWPPYSFASLEDAP